MIALAEAQARWARPRVERAVHAAQRLTGWSKWTIALLLWSGSMVAYAAPCSFPIAVWGLSLWILCDGPSVWWIGGRARADALDPAGALPPEMVRIWHLAAGSFLVLWIQLMLIPLFLLNDALPLSGLAGMVLRPAAFLAVLGSNLRREDRFFAARLAEEESAG